MMSRLFAVVQILFYLFLAVFLLGGVGIVATQSVGVLAHNGSIVLSVKQWLAPMTYGCASLCALCAFVLNYRPAGKKYTRAK